jgi:hypothetical protein
MKFDIKRILEKKGRTTEDWLHQNQIDSQDKLLEWEGDNSDFELSQEFRDEIASILKLKEKPTRKSTKKVDAEKKIEYPSEDINEKQKEENTNETSEEQKL